MLDFNCALEGEIRAAAQGPVVTRNLKGQEQNPKVRGIQKGLGRSIKAAGFRQSVAVW